MWMKAQIKPVYHITQSYLVTIFGLNRLIHMDFWVNYPFNLKQFIDLSQSAIFNFWQKWRQGYEQQKYSVFIGLYSYFTT